MERPAVVGALGPDVSVSILRLLAMVLVHSIKIVSLPNRLKAGNVIAFRVPVVKTSSDG